MKLHVARVFGLVQRLARGRELGLEPRARRVRRRDLRVEM